MLPKVITYYTSPLLFSRSPILMTLLLRNCEKAFSAKKIYFSNFTLFRSVFLIYLHYSTGVIQNEGVVVLINNCCMCFGKNLTWMFSSLLGISVGAKNDDQTLLSAVSLYSQSPAWTPSSIKPTKSTGGAMTTALMRTD